MVIQAFLNISQNFNPLNSCYLKTITLALLFIQAPFLSIYSASIKSKDVYAHP